MENQTPQEALRELASRKDAKRPKRARLRQLLPEIEAAQAAGATNAEIVETLNAQGIDMTLSAFQTALSRIRNPSPSKRRQGASEATPYPNPAGARGAPAGQVQATRSGAAEPATTGKPEQAEPPTHGDDGLPLTRKQQRELVADQFVPRAGTGPLSPRMQRLLNKDTK
ncbi:hypothetical protein [Xanthomonas nasturtii]|uniref:hypothetical protein n=1 Tax=Xanthomonas nasturtii TaxID=1843581 RepID=UPI0020110029|nr:hypothetical protein [Xanthomonas nasturtii]MCL1574877.1 hypothetical protein [Xanthomonas nasturtii]